ncbi:probable dipeptidyl peptidase 4, partial [Eurytemora carolleeae]|uniref:probable dipeptidyl peptidase 4 n=1 Tax=Eurytemora carolleeae TaxID=1294199 RepID=UPI000C764774
MFSPSCKAYVQNCKGPCIPYSKVYELPSNSLLLTLDTNSRLHQLVNLTALPHIRYMSIQVADHQFAKLKIIIPPGYSDTDRISFPTLYEIYGGPGHQLVSKQWSVDWVHYIVISRYGGPGHQLVSKQWSVDWVHYMSSAKGFVIVIMDLRGSGFQ